MVIEFTGSYAQNENFGISFQAKMDGNSISCVVSKEALQDIKPSGRLDGALQQYLSNQSRLESIAENKIRNGEAVNNKVFINQVDVL